MSLLTDYVDAHLAELPTLFGADTALPLGYGLDLNSVIGPDGDLDFDDDYSYMDPRSPHAVGVAILRRLGTPRSTLIHDVANYGLDVRGLLNTPQTPQALSSLQRLIQSECLKDDRCANAEVTVAFTATRLSVTLRITPADASGAFDLTFWVSDGRLEALNG